MTEHPGEQFPPDVDPDVEPGFDPYPSEDTPETPDYDAEPAPQNFTHNQSYGEETATEPYGAVADELGTEPYGGDVVDAEGAAAEAASGSSADESEVDSEAAFEASLDEPAPAEAENEQAEESAGAHVDPAEVEFGPEFARPPGQEHEHSYAAEPAAAEQEPAEVAGDAESVEDGAAYDPAEGVVPDESAVGEYSAGQEVPEEDRAHPLVEETMGRLGELRDRPVAEHAEVYADLHERLQSALVEADADSGDRA